MANRFQKFVYYSSAFVPVLIVFAIVLLIEKTTWTQQMKINWIIPVFLLVLAMILIIVFLLFFKKAKRDLPIMEIHGSEYECIDSWLVAYVIAYMLPFATLVLGDVIWVVLCIAMILLMAVLVFTDYATPHPILFCKGYHFYELKIEGSASNYIVISRKQIRSVDNIRKVSRVFEFLFIRLG